jgi:hypothetical protein
LTNDLNLAQERAVGLAMPAIVTDLKNRREKSVIEPVKNRSLHVKRAKIAFTKFFRK